MAGGLLVVSACSKAKRRGSAPPCDDLVLGDPAHRARLLAAANGESVATDHWPAAELYTGREHRLVCEGVAALRASAPELRVEHWIISAGFGLVRAATRLPAYECSFSGMAARRRRAWAETLGLPAAYRALAERDALLVLLVGADYLDALARPADFAPRAREVVLAGGAAARRVGAGPRAALVHAGSAVARARGRPPRIIKGFLFREWARRVTRLGAPARAALIDDADRAAALFVEGA